MSSTTGSGTPLPQNASGWKHYLPQLTSFPFVRHLWFGDKKDLPLPGNETTLQTLETYLVSNRSKYQQFLRQKGRYPSYDIYACFHPFNEAFKALYPFVNYLKQHLKEGDTILNLWDRSGWTASMLAGWFPQQQIITVWEGDKDILGYRGFDYWMAPERREQHTILFADFERPLPLQSASIAAVIGFDVLHRFHQPELLSELLRIASPQAPMIFPHVHLTNNMPEPFFERGCRQLHGTDYQYLFDSLATAGRSGFVLSEPATFMWNDKTTDKEKVLISEPANTDYNACIAWLPKAPVPVLQPWRGHEQENWKAMYLLQNPLLAINPLQHTVTLGSEHWGYDIAEFLVRHPVYQKKVAKSLGAVIEEDFRLVLYWAGAGLRLHQIQEKTGLTEQRLQQILQKAWDLDLAQALPVDEAGFRLQTLLGQQRYLVEEQENTVTALWQNAVANHATSPWCNTSGEVITYEQAGELTALIQKALAAEGLNKGDSILLCGELHPELLLLFWAAVTMGVVVVPLSSKQAAARIEAYTALIRPALIFTEPAQHGVLKKLGAAKVIMVDAPDDPQFIPEQGFECWLETALQSEKELHIEMPKPQDMAVVLWTTGSTGNPKGIPITQAQLLRSGRLMTETYHWKSSDRYYALGGLETMSGLRHATVSVAEVGACCVLPEKSSTIHEHLKKIETEKISILTANPAFFKQLLLAAKASGTKQKTTLRLALCTGNQLRAELRHAWRQNMGIPLYNYYGLTETTGICIAEPLHQAAFEDNSIGVPVDSLVKVVDEAGNPVPAGTPGELCIYGAGVFQGYFKNATATKAVLNNGWFRTGDVVVQNEKGWLYLHGRLSDIVKLPSGERIEVRAVDDVLESIAGLNDWAVCPLRDWERESIALFIVPEPTVDHEALVRQIRHALKEHIGAFALPALIEPVSFIPRGNHHKVLRHQLTETYFQTVKQA